VALALATLTGCQTWVAGMTLPSGWYLQHPPQYIAPSPVFPLSRELARQEEVAASPAPAGPLPQNLPNVVPGGAGGP
jgi:hypothetical protein